MEATDKKLNKGAEDPRRILYDFIPINAALVDHVRRLDGFSVSFSYFADMDFLYINDNPAISDRTRSKTI
jgi:hypothetical protein